VKNGKLAGIITSADIATISPELAEAAVHSEHLSAEQIEQASGRIDESVCEVCGDIKSDLYEVNGMWVCENCRDTMSE
jgi:RNA polymerase-binding transcription factor DksA